MENNRCTMERGTMFGRMRKLLEAYETMCKPYCQEVELSVQAFEILLYVARNQGMTTAQDISKKQSIKPTLLSFHVEKLVQAGYIERQPIEGNRRSIRLVCTPKAEPVVAKGREISERYTALILQGVEREELERLGATLAKIDGNAEKIRNGDC